MVRIAGRTLVLLAVVLALVAAVGAQPSRAADARIGADAQMALDEIANEAGYTNWADYKAALNAEQDAKDKEANQIVADALTYGRRVEQDLGTYGDIQATSVTEWVIDFNAGTILLRTGWEELDLSTGILEKSMTYWTPNGVQAATVWSVVKDGIETVTQVKDWLPGSVDLKPGDSRPAQAPSSSKAGTRPSSMDPKKDGSLGQASGGDGPLRGLLDAMVDAAGKEAANTQDTSDSKNDTSNAGTGANSDPSKLTDDHEDDSSAGTSTSSNVRWASESVVSEQTGNKYTAYEVTNEDGSKTIGTKTETPEGKVSCSQQKSDGSGEEDATCPSGMSDEPACTNDCERLYALVGIFCGGDMTCSAPTGPETSGSETDSGTSTNSSPGGHEESGPILAPGYRNADRPGAPKDFGNPLDAPVIDSIAPPDNGSVTDPANPGETEDIAQPGISLEMQGSLRDPVHAPGTEEPPPASDRPGTGDYDHNG